MVACVVHTENGMLDRILIALDKACIIRVKNIYFRLKSNPLYRRTNKRNVLVAKVASTDFT